jgi:hypothetical protein
MNPKDFAKSLCSTASKDELFELIVEIAAGIDDFDFDKRIMKCFTAYIDYADNVMRGLNEGSL